MNVQLKNLTELCEKNNNINTELYKLYDVKRGLRDINGKGVLAGLTDISEVRSSKTVDGETIQIDGELYYRGYNVEDIINNCVCEKRYGFEEVTYLLLFGQLPTQSELNEFSKLLASYRSLPPSFVRDIIMKAPSPDMMNTLSRSVLTLYAYDETADDISHENVLRQCLQLIARFPLLSVYGYQVYRHYHCNDNLYIGASDPSLSTAENILHILRHDGNYSELESRVLDIALILHAEHGGGNNSSFTTHVVTSSGTDTYSTIAAALGSLKGPKHGGANIKVIQMFNEMKEVVTDWTDDNQVEKYLTALLDKEAFDKSGLIYGMGHAVYSLSDPRAEIIKGYVENLSVEKGLEKEFALYAKVEQLAAKVIAEKKKIYKGVSANVDFYSGFVYQMLGLPTELYTPIFALSRISGWSAHRLEELINEGKIIRPAYKSISEEKKYISINDR
jgi:Citrate synthase